MRLHDNTKQIMVKLHTLKGRWFQYLVYLNDFNPIQTGGRIQPARTLDVYNLLNKQAKAIELGDFS